MSRRTGALLVGVVVAVGAFIWWYNRPPTIIEAFVSPSVANVGEQVSLFVSVTGASRIRASTDLELVTPFTETDERGVFTASCRILAAPRARATFCVTASRGWWGQAQTTVTLLINHPPRIEQLLITRQAGLEQDIQLGMSDPDGDPCSYSVSEPPSFGSVRTTSDGLVYTPATSFAGYDRFPVRVEDGRGGNATAWVEIVEPPNYFGSYRTLAEILLAPPTDIYGSSVHLWQYFNFRPITWEYIIPLAVITGHAEHLTCRQASAAAASAWLMLAQHEQESFLTAGFGYLAASDPKAGGEDTASTPEDALSELDRSFEFLRDVTGLAEVFHVAAFDDYREAVDLIGQCASGFTEPEPLAVRLRLSDFGPSMPLVVPFFLLGVSPTQFLELELPSQSVLGELFSRLQDLHLENLEREMISEKKRLRDTYRNWAEEDEEELAQLKWWNQLHQDEMDLNLAPSCPQTPPLSAWMEENGYYARWTRDYETGRVVPLDPPEWISYAKRLCQLPSAIEFSLELARQMEHVLQELSALLETGRLRALNDSILIDCFLRGWQLPFESEDAESLYQQWLSMRSAAWARIYCQLADQGIPLSIICHGNVVFRAVVDDDLVRVIPYFVLDGADAALVLDPGAGVVRYTNWWDMRESEPAYGSAEEVPAEALASLERAQVALRNHQPDQARTYFLQSRWHVARPTFEQGQHALAQREIAEAVSHFQQAATIAPLGTASNLLTMWWASFPEAPAASYTAAKDAALREHVIDSAVDVVCALGAPEEDTRAEWLVTAADYLVRPGILATYIAINDLLVDLIDKAGSSSGNLTSLVLDAAAVEQEYGNAGYLADAVSLIAANFAGLVQQVWSVALDHGLQECLPASSGTSASEDPDGLSALRSIADASLRESLTAYVHSIDQLHRILTHTEASLAPLGNLFGDSASADDVLDCIRRGGDPLDCMSKRSASNSQVETNCSQLRREVSSSVAEYRRQLKASFGIANWQAVRSQVEELQSRTLQATSIDRVAWKELVAQQLFQLALDNGQDAAIQHEFKALEIAEEAAVTGLRLGIVDPLATWVEMEWRCGLYRRAVDALLGFQRPLCLLSSSLQFSDPISEVNACDWFTVREEGDTLVCLAEPGELPVLQISGFATPEDRDALREQINGLPDDRLVHLEDGNLAQNLLATSFPLLPSTGRLREAIEGLSPLFLKCLAYGWYISDELMPTAPRCPSFLVLDAGVASRGEPAFLDESQYLPSLLAVESAEELAQLPRRIVADADRLHEELSAAGGALTLYDRAPVPLLTSLTSLERELLDALQHGTMDALRQRFPFLRGSEGLESGGCVTFCEVEGQQLALIMTPAEDQSLEQRPIATVRGSSGQLALLTAEQATEWIVTAAGAGDKYSAWQWLWNSTLCLKLGETLCVATAGGLMPLSEGALAILARRPGELEAHDWRTLIDEVFPAMFESVNYEVTWDGDRPRLELGLGEGQRFFVDVPPDPCLREVLWSVLRGNPIVWVAASSDSLAAADAVAQASLNLDAPLRIVISCPSEYYGLPNIRSDWDQARDSLIARIREWGLPITVHDLSDLGAGDAVGEVKRLLTSEESQVLGFFHRVDSNTFEVGQAGSLGRDEIAHLTPSASEDRFFAILGCEPLQYGLNDALIESGLTSATLTVGEELTSDRVFHYLSELIEQWEREVSSGRKRVPMTDILPETEISPMAEANRSTGMG